MITPTFKVDQDDDSVTIVIHTPYVRVQDVDLYVEGSEFRFYLRPYFLRLHFPGNIIEDDNSKAVYDPSAGEFTIRVSKETKGEEFADLDLLTKLLARTGEAETKDQPKKPMIEVIGSSSTADDGREAALEENEIQEAIDFNWEIPQQVPKSEALSITARYGFDQQYHGYFTHVHETLNEINEIQDPERSTSDSVREERINSENDHFDEDHYCMDYIHNDEIKELIKYKTIYAKELKRLQKIAKAADTKSLLKFTTNEEAMMRDLPRKEYLLSFEKSAYLGLVDLMFAYSYNHRITEGENNVESVWCIGKISPTLSSLEVNMTIKK
ncbi:SHQ1 protein-domain-containing protein [Cokeromyces recurvatus]|uniref:SHQ1 protein-domain-containing protein n=1 Tax=Cokeromyces recurvatus TaxID=90255 RepID=UPI002221187B|nr:SHQ1 protein-domain-containing protein [Cokeromyces recurvatus]KAI7906890.1 SHQ1 protein-domain-containing protein [Cokeromyces recurvatus]